MSVTQTILTSAHGSDVGLRRRELLEWVVLSVLPWWMVCAVTGWSTFVEPDVEPPFFWALVAVSLVVTLAVFIAAPRRVTRTGSGLTVRYGCGYARTMETGPFTRAVWMPQFRTVHRRYGLLVLVDTGHRRVRLDTRLFPAGDLMALAAGTAPLEHISDEISARQVRRKHPGVLPLRDSRPVLLALVGWGLAGIAVFGIPILTGLVPL